MKLLAFLMIITFFHSDLLAFQEDPPIKYASTNRAQFRVTVTLDHIGIPPGLRKRPKESKYVQKKWHTDWGLSAGLDLPLTQNLQLGNQWFQSFSMGYIMNDGVQHGWKVETETFLRTFLGKGDNGFVQFGIPLGYMRSFPIHGAYRINGLEVKRETADRGHFIFGLNPGFGYGIRESAHPCYASVNYRFWMQSGFIPGVVPMLPHRSWEVNLGYQVKN